LKENLERDGHSVCALPRKYENSINFKNVDAVVHLAGESIANGRWTEEKRKRIEESRIHATTQLSKQISLSDSPPSVFICASAIGYYGDRGDELLDESSNAGKGFLPEVCTKWEESTKLAEEAGVRTIRIRTGIVLSTEGGALTKMLPPFKCGVGGILGSGKQYMSWISLDDEVSIIRYLIEKSNMSGSVNLVAPHPVTNREFTKTLGQIIKRPTIIPVPAFAAHMLFGEMADALLLSSARVLPNRLIDSGYAFKHSTLASALRSIFQ
jgi:hypothetical protein